VKNAKQWRTKDLDFMQAAKLRDDIKKLQGQLT
jgi:protein-arginine kinase activator protein McsA